jgi:hypothetical protein
LGYIRIIAGRIGAIVPGLRSVALAIVVISIVRIIAPPGVCDGSAEEKPTIAESVVVEPTIVESLSAESTSMKSSKSAVKPTKSTAVKPTKSTAVKPAHAAAVEPADAATPAMRPGKSKIWLTERGSTYQTSCDCKSAPYAGPGPVFA